MIEVQLLDHPHSDGSYALLQRVARTLGMIHCPASERSKNNETHLPRCKMRIRFNGATLLLRSDVNATLIICDKSSISFYNSDIFICYYPAFEVRACTCSIYPIILRFALICVLSCVRTFPFPVAAGCVLAHLSTFSFGSGTLKFPNSTNILYTTMGEIFGLC